MTRKKVTGQTRHLFLGLYSLESLQGAAARFAAKARVELEPEGELCGVRLSPRRALAPEGVAELWGEFLNEALCQQYRAAVESLNRESLWPVVERALARGTTPPGDWAREREPQVAADREREFKALAAEARRRGAR